MNNQETPPPPPPPATTTTTTTTKKPNTLTFGGCLMDGPKDVKKSKDVGVWKMTGYFLGMHHSLAQNWQTYANFIGPGPSEAQQESSSIGSMGSGITVDGRNPAPVEVGSLCRYLQVFIHPRWCRISSINCIFKTTYHFRMLQSSKIPSQERFRWSVTLEFIASHRVVNMLWIQILFFVRHTKQLQEHPEK